MRGSARATVRAHPLCHPRLTPCGREQLRLLRCPPSTAENAPRVPESLHFVIRKNAINSIPTRWLCPLLLVTTALSTQVRSEATEGPGDCEAGAAHGSPFNLEPQQMTTLLSPPGCELLQGSGLSIPLGARMWQGHGKYLRAESSWSRSSAGGQWRSHC